MDLFFSIFDEKRATEAQAGTSRGYDRSTLVCSIHSAAILRTSAVPALVNIDIELSTGRYPNTSPEHFDRFFRIRARYLLRESEDRRNYGLSRLSPMHTTHPRAEPAQEFLKAHYAVPEDTIDKQRDVSLGRGGGVPHGMFLNASSQLDAVNRLTDAKLLSQRYQDLFGEPLAFRVCATSAI